MFESACSPKSRIRLDRTLAQRSQRGPCDQWIRLAVVQESLRLFGWSLRAWEKTKKPCWMVQFNFSYQAVAAQIEWVEGHSSRHSRSQALSLNQRIRSIRLLGNQCSVEMWSKPQRSSRGTFHHFQHRPSCYWGTKLGHQCTKLSMVCLWESSRQPVSLVFLDHTESSQSVSDLLLDYLLLEAKSITLWVGQYCLAKV